MREFIARILDALAASLLGQAARLVRVATARHLVGEYQAAYEDVTALQAGGQERLARFLESELNEALAGTSSSAPRADGVPLSRNGAGDGGPFVLSGPAAAVTGPSECPGAASEPARRRGRPRSAANGRRGRARKLPEAAEAIDESTSSTVMGG